MAGAVLWLSWLMSEFKHEHLCLYSIAPYEQSILYLICFNWSSIDLIASTMASGETGAICIASDDDGIAA